jgi:2-dehydropantoate 2-reductase
LKIGIVGAGAMGSLLGFHLAARAEVWMLTGWQAQIDALSARGITCEDGGVAQTRRVHAAADPAEIGACDLVLVLVKSHQTVRAATQALALVEAAPLASAAVTFSALQRSVFTLQNGLGNREILAATLGAERVGQGVTTLGATLLGPGRVRQTGRGDTTFGAGPNAEAARVLVELFLACGLPAGLTDDLDGLVWGKLVVNAGINALSALLRVPNGALAELPNARELLSEAVAEAAAVAQARGVALPYADPIAHTLSVARATAANQSSMLQDILRGSRSEIEAINGAVVREGMRLGVATPVNATLTRLVRALDEQ